jgi:hypothetical protein
MLSIKNGGLKKVALSAAIFSLTFSSVGFADGGHDHHGGGNDYSVERRLNDLQRQIDDLSQSLRRLERRVDDLIVGPPAPPVDRIDVCMVTDGLYKRAYLGVGRTKMDAEYAARNACQTALSSFPQYCGASSSQIKCDDNYASYGGNYTCMLSDDLYHKMYRGSGRTAVEATAKAVQSCQSSLSSFPQYCSSPTTRCEQEGGGQNARD